MKKYEKEKMNLNHKIKIDNFLDDYGRITQLPQKKTFRAATLCYLAEKFASDRDYTEKEVNSICEEWHTFGDYFILRRELINNGLLCREPNGSRYWKPTAFHPIDSYNWDSEP
jgi:hypothetical protein